MDYCELNQLRREYAKRHGNEAAAALVMKHGGRTDDGEASLAAVPVENHGALADAFEQASGAAGKVRPKTFAELYGPAFRKFNAAKRRRRNE